MSSVEGQDGCLMIPILPAIRFRIEFTKENYTVNVQVFLN